MTPTHFLPLTLLWVILSAFLIAPGNGFAFRDQPTKPNILIQSNSTSNNDIFTTVAMVTPLPPRPQVPLQHGHINHAQPLLKHMTSRKSLSNITMHSQEEASYGLVEPLRLYLPLTNGHFRLRWTPLRNFFDQAGMLLKSIPQHFIAGWSQLRNSFVQAGVFLKSIHQYLYTKMKEFETFWIDYVEPLISDYEFRSQLLNTIPGAHRDRILYVLGYYRPLEMSGAMSSNLTGSFVQK